MLLRGTVHHVARICGDARFSLRLEVVLALEQVLLKVVGSKVEVGIGDRGVRAESAQKDSRGPRETVPL